MKMQGRCYMDWVRRCPNRENRPNFAVQPDIRSDRSFFLFCFSAIIILYLRSTRIITASNIRLQAVVRPFPALSPTLLFPPY